MESSPFLDRALRVVAAEGVRRVLQHRRPDRTGRDAIAADVEAGMVKSDRRREADDAALGSRVGSDGLLRGKRLDGRGVDNGPAAALAHLGNGVLAGEERALEIDSDLKVPIVLAQLLDGAVADDPGVVIENVYTAESLDSGVDEPFHLLRGANV